jgi:hypothetical protein
MAGISYLKEVISLQRSDCIVHKRYYGFHRNINNRANVGYYVAYGAAAKSTAKSSATSGEASAISTAIAKAAARRFSDTAGLIVNECRAARCNARTPQGAAGSRTDAGDQPYEAGVAQNKDACESAT